MNQEKIDDIEELNYFISEGLSLEHYPLIKSVGENFFNNDNLTLLDTAISNYNTESVYHLLMIGSDPNLHNSNHWMPPLNSANLFKLPDIFIMLLLFGADPSISNGRTFSIKTEWETYGYRRFVDELWRIDTPYEIQDLEYISSVDFQKLNTNQIEELLIYSIISKDETLLWQLLSRKVNINKISPKIKISYLELAYNESAPRIFIMLLMQCSLLYKEDAKNTILNIVKNHHSTFLKQLFKNDFELINRNASN